MKLKICSFLFATLSLSVSSAEVDDNHKVKAAEPCHAYFVKINYSESGEDFFASFVLKDAENISGDFGKQVNYANAFRASSEKTPQTTYFASGSINKKPKDAKSIRVEQLPAQPRML